MNMVTLAALAVRLDDALEGLRAVQDNVPGHSQAAIAMRDSLNTALSYATFAERLLDGMREQAA